MSSLFSELKRRNVFRVVIAYVVLGWIVLQVGETLAPALHLPLWVNSLLAFFVILGFPFAIFFAWAFELTPEGLKKEKDVDRSQSITHVTGRKLDFIIIGILVVALGYFGWQHWVAEQDNGAPSTTVASGKPTIAVMPFINMSSDPEQEYFSDGLSEELLNLLAQIPELHVTSRSSSFAFKGKEITVPEFARAMHVAHVLEGSVRKSGSTIRITAQLIKAESDGHMWSATWDRTLDDVFQIQDEIAKAVVDMLKIELLGDAPRAQETSGEAYAMYLQAQQLIGHRTATSYAQAEQLLSEALDLDANYAPAWAGLGQSYFASGGTGVRRPEESARLAREAAQKALAIDPANLLALRILGGIAAVYDWDYDAATEYAARALRARPGDSETELAFGGVAFDYGDYETATKHDIAAFAHDPLNAIVLLQLGYAEFFNGDLDAAFATFQKGKQLSPNATGFSYYMASVLIAQGEFEEALQILEGEVHEGFRHTGRAIAYFGLGDVAASDIALAELNKLGDSMAYQRVAVYALRGEADLAFKHLEIAMEWRDRGLNLILGDSMLDNIRDDPRFADVLRRMNRTAAR